MEIQILKKFEGETVRVILKNNFIYSYIVFKITEEGLIEFEDKFGEILTIEPNYISAVTKIKRSENDN